MKRITLIAALTVSVALLALGQTTNKSASQSSKAEQEVLKANKEYDEAIVRQDAAAYDRILADEYTFTSSEGEVVNKAQEMERVKSGELKYESGQSDDVHVRVYGDTAVVTGRWTWKGQRKGQAAGGVDRYTAVFVKRDGRWRIVAEQTTGIAQK